MAKQNKQDKGNGSDINVYVMATFGFAVLLWIFWFAFHNFITWLAMRTRQYELLALGTIVKPIFSDNYMLKLSNFYASNSSVNLTFGSFLQIMRESGIYVVYIYCPIIMFIGWRVWILAPTENFKRKHTMDSLSKQESDLWPEIKPPLMQRLDKGDMQKGPWRISLSEWEFARAHKLVSYKDGHAEDAFIIPGAPKEDDHIFETIDKVKARNLFIEQLGPRWQTHKKIPPYIRGIYAALAVRILAIPLIDPGKKKALITESDRLFRSMAIDYAEKKGDFKKMDFSWADDIIEKNAKFELIELAHQRHAYVYTVMATMLQVARADGVLASSMFTWLRPVDRRLWYILENVGGYCFVPECAGISSHWLAEKSIGVRLLYPSVDEAVSGLELGLQSYTESNEALDMFK